MPMLLPGGVYAKFVRTMPILCVDLVLKRGDEYILVKRSRSPASGHWWVPGGRVLKGETISDAARRKASEELGIDITLQRFLGIYEGHFNRGSRDSRHTVSVVLLASPKSLRISLDHQSSAWKLSRTLPNDFKITRFRP